MWWNKGNGDIMGKLDEIELKIEKHKPVIFGILEANIGTDCHTPVIQMEEFELERDNLNTSQIRTRAAVYISCQIDYKRRLDLETSEIPMIWLEIKSKKSKPWLIMIGYRQWRTLGKNGGKKSGTMTAQITRLKLYERAILNAGKENKEIIITGDMNIDVTPWTNPSKPLTLY